jgi:transcriptional regulator with XRE-family HTH domain
MPPPTTAQPSAYGYATPATASAAPPKRLPTVGELIRQWRTQRRLSQLDLAGDAGISARHLSFVETGRAAPSRELLLRLFERLHVPLRARNTLLMAGGFAPMYQEFALDHPSQATVRQVVESVVRSHEPFPAMAVDRHWNLLVANKQTRALMQLASPALVEAPCNVMRLALHPDGLARYIRNLPLWREHLLQRLHRQVEMTGDADIFALLREIEGYPCPPAQQPMHTPAHAPTHAPMTGAEAALPVEFDTPMGTLRFITTLTVFGSPVEVTVSEIALECLYPADEATRQAMLALQ